MLFLFLSSQFYCQPKLYFSSKDVLGLQQKARQQSHREIFSRITSAVTEMKKQPQEVIPSTNWTVFSGSWNEIYGNNLACLAFYCLMNSTDERAFRIAEKAILR